MFRILFGWSKASKCKREIKRARHRLRLLKNKRQAMATQLRKDLAELILNGHEEIAVKRVERLIQDENLIAAYGLLDQFSEFILKQLSYIRKHRDCPDDINEAASSLIFASARCGDFPELYSIRKLFGHRYGKEFATAAVELFPGNLVNQKLKENLSVKSVSDDLKYRIVDEIAKDNGLQPKMIGYKGNHELVAEESEMHALEGDVSCNRLSITIPSDAYSQSESTLNDTSALVSTVQKYPNYSQQEKVEDKGKIMALSSAETVEDSDDEFQECQYFVSEETSCLTDESDKDQDDESDTENSRSIRSYKERKHASKKKIRKRSALFERQGEMEIGYMIYYQKPCRSRSPSTTQSSYPQKRQKQQSLLCQCQGGSERNSSEFECSLDKPCYCCVYNDYESWEALSMKPKKGIISNPLCHDEPNKGMELVAAGYDLLTYPDSLTRTETTPYSRALTMPPMSPKSCQDNWLRTDSCTSEESQQPKHVHPKLPVDYDNFISTFTALKKECTLRQQ